MFGGKTIHWDFWSLFLDRLEERFLPTIMSVSHPVHTAMVALGLEMAVRAHRRLTNATYALPALLLAWAILAHAAYNGQYSLPDWIMKINEWTGSGYKTKIFVLMLLVVGFVAFSIDLLFRTVKIGGRRWKGSL